jgi:hypothetical protein
MQNARKKKKKALPFMEISWKHFTKVFANATQFGRGLRRRIFKTTFFDTLFFQIH